MSRCLVSVGVLVAVAVLASACSGKALDAGNSSLVATSSAPSVSSAAGGLPYAGAPKVSNPLPASIFSGDPCADALTAKQIDDLLGSPVTKERDDTPQVGSDCAWTNLERGSQVSVGYSTISRTGLSGIYQNTQPQSALWKPLPDIQGFPAVAHAGRPGQPAPKDFCMVSVGMTDDIAVGVSVSLGRARIGSVDPCDVAGQAADAVASTLKAKAGS